MPKEKKGLFRWWAMLPMLMLALGLALTTSAVLAGREAAPAADKNSVDVAGNQVYAYGLTGTSSKTLIVFDKTDPAIVYSSTTVTGLQAGETLQGIDFRPATGQLYALGSSNRIYKIAPLTGAATIVGSGPITVNVGSVVGFDFNPVPDRIRIVSTTDQNLRVNPDTGALVVDGTLTYTSTDVNAGASPNIVGVAYINSSAGVTSTTLYDLDSNLNILARQNPPNEGKLTTIGPLGVDFSSATGFDIEPTNNVAYAVLQPTGASGSSLYTINLTTGAATLVGPIGTGSTVVTGLALPGNYIPDGGAAAYTRQLTGTGNVTSIDVTGLTISHTFPGDLDVYLSSPDGVKVKLFGDICGGTDWNAANTGFTLSDGATEQIGDTCPPGNGVYRPESPLSAFAGSPISGTWMLEVLDTSLEDIGMVLDFNLVSPGGAPQATQTSTVLPTLEPTRTPVLGSENFTDVSPTDYFYEGVWFLTGKNAISGYNDADHCGTASPCYKPYNMVTRGQLTKIVILGLDIPLLGSPPILALPEFTDVPASNPFYLYILTARTFGIINGYDDAEHCGTATPCFRAFDMVTRGQIAKIIVEATGWDTITPQAATFSDVPASNAFFSYVETAACYGVISGYADGTFKPFNPATRGQVTKITYLGYTQTSADACNAAPTQIAR